MRRVLALAFVFVGLLAVPALAVQSAIIGFDPMVDGSDHYGDHVWLSNPNGIVVCVTVQVTGTNITGGVSSPVVLQPGEQHVYIGALQRADNSRAADWHVDTMTYGNDACSPK